MKSDPSMIDSHTFRKVQGEKSSFMTCTTEEWIFTIDTRDNDSHYYLQGPGR